jgi:spermidine synthase
LIPWVIVASARVPGGGTMSLARRGEEWVIRVDGRDLMRSAAHASEAALADLACREIRSHSPRVLVGGLGMGYTLAEALRALPRRAEVVVAEVVPEVVEWNRGPLADLAGRPLRDPRVTVEIADVAELLGGRFDAILLDLDNGPAALSHPANARLYSDAGIAACRRALGPRGVLATWSAADDPSFTSRLARGGFSAKVHRVAAHGTRGRKHAIWIATPRPSRPMRSTRGRTRPRRA